MTTSIRREGIVTSDGTIEVSVPELQPGQRVSITIETESVTVAYHSPGDGVHIIDLIRGTPGQRLFRTVEEVDDYLRQERDSWDR